MTLVKKMGEVNQRGGGDQKPAFIGHLLKASML